MTLAQQIAFAVLSVVSLGSAALVVFTRDVTRLALALGMFFLAIAGWFVYFGHSFLAVSQVFVYVGGVLVLVLFAIMLVHRSEAGSPELESRHAFDAAMVAALVFAVVLIVAREAGPLLGDTLVDAGVPTTVDGVLLGRMLPHFEAAGLLLLAALVAAIVVGSGDDE